MNLTFVIYAAGGPIAAAIAYRLLHIRRSGRKRVVHHRRVVVPPPIGDTDYSVTCVLGVNGGRSKCSVERITSE